MKRLLEVADTREAAKKMRQTFMDRPPKGEKRLGWGWPPEMRRVGKGLAVMYTSDKWHDDGDFTDYKHIAEAPQDVLFTPSFSVRGDGRRGVALHGELVTLVEPMPSHVALLAPFLGLQVHLYDEGGALRRNRDDRLVEIEIPRARLGGTRHPETNEPFLVIYREAEILCLITGKELDVEKDGISG